MQKRALIYLNHLNIGGAEKSNLHLIKRMQADGWDIELVLKSSGGTMEDQIPGGIKLSHLDGGLFKGTEAGSRFKNPIKDLFRRLVQKLNLHRYKGRRYDLAINGLQADASFITEYIDAGIRLQWIRIDLDAIRRLGRPLDNLTRYMDRLDGYICISQGVYASLTAILPHLKDRAFILYNFFDREEILQKARQEDANPFAAYDPSLLRVVTVCRIHDQQKGVFRMLNVYQRLHDEGIRFYWFLVGGGPDRADLIARVQACGLEDGFICLGSTGNPFPYYLNADLCATLSYYEGFGRTVTEAKLMGRAVIATEFAGIHDQIQHLANGYIVGNDEDSIYEGMKILLQDQVLLRRLTNDHLPEVLVDEDMKAKRLYDIIEELRQKRLQRTEPG